MLPIDPSVVGVNQQFFSKETKISSKKFLRTQRGHAEVKLLLVSELLIYNRWL